MKYKYILYSNINISMKLLSLPLILLLLASTNWLITASPPENEVELKSKRLTQEELIGFNDDMASSIQKIDSLLNELSTREGNQKFKILSDRKSIV